MKIWAKTQVTVHIELTSREAIWLRDYMQNACGNLEEEDEETSKMRYKLFTDLQKELEEGGEHYEK